MRHREIQPGEKFGRWAIIARAENLKGGHVRYEALCECGQTGQPRAETLLSGRSQSCGCLTAERICTLRLKHGMSGNTPEYQAWAHMIRRCHTPSTKGFEGYGGRGIVVCNRWRSSFEYFLADMGPRPSPKHSLDRINNDGNYDPNNCRWATSEQQLNNTRRNRTISYRGEVRTVTEWGRVLGLPRGVIADRLKRGWSIEKALSAPLSEGNSANAKAT